MTPNLPLHKTKTQACSGCAGRAVYTGTLTPLLARGRGTHWELAPRRSATRTSCMHRYGLLTDIFHIHSCPHHHHHHRPRTPPPTPPPSLPPPLGTLSPPPPNSLPSPWIGLFHFFDPFGTHSKVDFNFRVFVVSQYFHLLPSSSHPPLSPPTPRSTSANFDFGQFRLRPIFGC